MEFEDVFALLVTAALANAIAWTLLYFFAVHYFAAALKKHACAIWEENKSPSLLLESHLTRAFRIYHLSQQAGTVSLPVECAAPRDLVESRLLYAIVSIVAMMLIVAMFTGVS